jgi:hypothetical protein
MNFDKTPFPHRFNVNDLVWYEDFAPLGKNPKLTPKWQGPAKITEVNNINARILLPNGKSKVLKIMRLNKFFSAPNDLRSENDTPTENLDFNREPKITGPVTRAMKKLMDHKNAMQLAINVLCDLSKKRCTMCEWEQECSDNPSLYDPIFARQYIKEHHQCALIANYSLDNILLIIKPKTRPQLQTAFINNATISIKVIIATTKMLFCFKILIPRN